jgi:flagellar export protein FliJ
VSDLDTLIRLHRWQLDEKRRALADLQALADRLTDETARLDEEVAAESAFAAASAVPPPTFPAYLEASKVRRERLAESLAQAHRRMAAVGEEIAEAYQELKKYELAQAGRERRAEQRAKRAETAAYDEIAAIGHMRRQAGAAGEG